MRPQRYKAQTDSPDGCDRDWVATIEYTSDPGSWTRTPRHPSQSCVIIKWPSHSRRDSIAPVGVRQMLIVGTPNG